MREGRAHTVELPERHPQLVATAGNIYGLRDASVDPRVLTQVLLWAVLSLAWNLLSGYGGYFSFGHAAFWGLGAYTVALGMIDFGLTPWLTIPLCAVVGSLAGALIGYPTFRLRGHYFALSWSTAAAAFI